jgi:hypothetical protein
MASLQDVLAEWQPLAGAPSEEFESWLSLLCPFQLYVKLKQ